MGIVARVDCFATRYALRVARRHVEAFTGHDLTSFEALLRIPGALRALLGQQRLPGDDQIG